MKTELKKLMAFGLIISLFTSVYVTFIGTGMRQGFFSSHFFLTWVKQIPVAYLIVMPYVLITGPLARKIADRLFRSGNSSSVKPKTI